MIRQSSIVGSLLGAAVGDALGLPYEGLSARRGRRMWGEPDRHRLLPGRGMVSDDTEHACLAAAALVEAGNDVERFQRSLASGLRRWLLSAPAGIGLATLRATARLCLGVPASRSGVFSAGNGPAMRAAIVGAAVADPDLMRRLIRASTRITHTDPKAEHGALAVALAARMVSEASEVGRTLVSGQAFVERLREALAGEGADELLSLLGDAVASHECGASTADFARQLGLARGVSGYMLHTVPVIVQAWLGNQHDLLAGLQAVIRCGGDTDTTAAILGGIIGSAVGKEGIPGELLDGLWEWPHSVTWMEALAARLYDVRNGRDQPQPCRLPYLAVLPRNLAFAAIVLTHGFRRLLPPY